MKLYSINKSTGVEHADEGPWRDYVLFAEGNNKAELLKNGLISEVDQYGGDLCLPYSIKDAETDVYKSAVAMIEEVQNDSLSQYKITKSKNWHIAFSIYDLWEQTCIGWKKIETEKTYQYLVNRYGGLTPMVIEE